MKSLPFLRPRRGRLLSHPRDRHPVGRDGLRRRPEPPARQAQPVQQSGACPEQRDRDHRQHRDVRHPPVQQEGRRRWRRDLRLPLEPRQRAVHPRRQPQGRPRLRVRRPSAPKAAASRPAATDRRAVHDQRHRRRHRPQRRPRRRQGSGRLRARGRRHRAGRQPAVRRRRRSGARGPTARRPSPAVAPRPPTDDGDVYTVDVQQGREQVLVHGHPGRQHSHRPAGAVASPPGDAAARR